MDLLKFIRLLAEKLDRKTKLMRKIDNRQYKLTQIRSKQTGPKTNIRVKKGKRYDSKLDRRGIK